MVIFTMIMVVAAFAYILLFGYSGIGIPFVTVLRGGNPVVVGASSGKDLAGFWWLPITITVMAANFDNTLLTTQ